MIRVAVIMGKMHSGGKKNLVMEYYRHIDRSQVQFDFICDADSNSIPYDEIEALGGTIYKVSSYKNILFNFFQILKICKKNKYPIIHGYNSTMNIFAMLAGKYAGIPIRINESISMGHKDDRKNIAKNLLKPFSKCFSTHYVANGEECGKWQFGKKAYAHNEIKIFKTVIDTEKNKFDKTLRDSTREEFNIKNNIVIGHIGRLTEQKNTLFIIDIFNKIVQKEQSAKLLIIGDGNLRVQMLDRIKKYGIEEKVLYLGRREDIQKFYNAMDCFLLPSLYEGLPVVGVEAQCCGLPVFFSTEIPTESSPCDDLGFFWKLSESAEWWANQILEKVKYAIPRRTDLSLLVKKAGFDSKEEADKMLKFYMDAVKEKVYCKGLLCKKKV
jgi:glycosyltransferase involved in cell wall biosynthesis